MSKIFGIGLAASLLIFSTAYAQTPESVKEGLPKGNEEGTQLREMIRGKDPRTQRGKVDTLGEEATQIESLSQQVDSGISEGMGPEALKRAQSLDGRPQSNDVARLLEILDEKVEQRLQSDLAPYSILLRKKIQTKKLSKGEVVRANLLVGKSRITGLAVKVLQFDGRKNRYSKKFLRLDEQDPSTYAAWRVDTLGRTPFGKKQLDIIDWSNGTVSKIEYYKSSSTAFYNIDTYERALEFPNSPDGDFDYAGYSQEVARTIVSIQPKFQPYLSVIHDLVDKNFVSIREIQEGLFLSGKSSVTGKEVAIFVYGPSALHQKFVVLLDPQTGQELTEHTTTPRNWRGKFTSDRISLSDGRILEITFVDRTSERLSLEDSTTGTGQQVWNYTDSRH